MKPGHSYCKRNIRHGIIHGTVFQELVVWREKRVALLKFLYIIPNSRSQPSLNPFFADNHITSSIFAVRNRRTPMNGNHSAASAGLILKWPGRKPAPGPDTIWLYKDLTKHYQAVPHCHGDWRPCRMIRPYRKKCSPYPDLNFTAAKIRRTRERPITRIAAGNALISVFTRQMQKMQAVFFK